ncbi:MAG: glutamate synthase central domain-containing protein, partial [Termitinemataceae bacterium]
MGDHQQSTQGLYSQAYEHDACGIGFVADIKGRPSHDILERGLEVLERMEHRGAESADNKTGDGAGVLLQIPHEYYKTFIPKLPEKGTYGTGLVFLPGPAKDAGAEKLRTAVVQEIETQAAKTGLSVFAWRDVPTNSESIGAIAKKAEPIVKQIFLVPTSGSQTADLELQLYIFRKRLEKAVREKPELAAAGDFHFPSLSSKTIVYKGMLMSSQLRTYFTELTNPAMTTAVALVHSRFSTNTFPAWPLAQPFRMLAHNGEINTVKGNRFWMAARERLLAHPTFGDALQEILPVIEPGKSDSASLDNVLELLVMAGRSLPHALMMLIPESWNDKNPIPQELKAFYEYHACMMEPWDGPASVVFCDGRYVGGTLDRNGLRPSRYTITKDGLIVMASETGVQDFKPEEVAQKGRLKPGKLLLVDLQEGRIIPDEEVKKQIATQKPYAEWVKKQVVTLEKLPEIALGKTVVQPSDETTVLFMERAFGYTREDRDNLLLPMAESGQEPTSSMGTDTPIAVFSEKPQRPYAYFKQVFAQVTNPPIDSIREELVMTLTSFVGPQRNLLEETEQHCHRLKILNPVMTLADFERIKAWHDPEFKMKILDATFYVPSLGSVQPADQKGHLETALDRLVDEAVKAVEAGYSLIVLSDRASLAPEAGRCAIPALLATGAVHHGLIRAGLRMKASIIVDSADPREVMHFALLFGYGADLIVPYGALASIAAICRSADAERAGDYEHAEKNYLKGIQKAILKIMSKMGTSTLRSYRGAQIFEAIGLGSAVIDKCFRGTTSRIGGIGFAELENEAVARYREARGAYENQQGSVPT